MSKTIREQLTEYYKRQRIHPQKFDCQYQHICSSHAHQRIMTETKMSMVGSKYGTGYPKIVVVSLDPPKGKEGKFVEPHKRTTEYISNTHEAENLTVKRPNPHWAMTHIIVKDVLSYFGYAAQPGAAVVKDSYSGRPIENVTSYFAHVNVAKCSMNNPGKRQAARIVHDNCSKSYLMKELAILEPDILITQGKATNEIMGDLLVGYPVMEKDLPKATEVDVVDYPTLWLPMRHPTQQLKKIRKDWPLYVHAIREWANI